jgi:hypothetical protein
MKKVLILILVLGLFGCAKKQMIKHPEVSFATLTIEDEGKVDNIGEVIVTITEEKSKNPEGAWYRVGTWSKDRACLWRIALNVYGNPYRWIAIYEANEGRIDNPNLIYENQILLIPNLGGK